ncbi:MAG: methylglyoxal synthase [Candidatus Dormibacteria bacterium]
MSKGWRTWSGEMAITHEQAAPPSMLASDRTQFAARHSPPPTIAMIAHDREKVRLVDFAVCYRDILSRHRLLATATTGRMLAEMVGLEVECVRSVTAGGDRQVADAVAGGRVACVVFLVDAFSGRPHERRIEPVMKACSLHDIPLATNVATARAVLHAVAVAELRHAAWSNLEQK